MNVLSSHSGSGLWRGGDAFVDVAVRDVAELKEIGLPIWARFVRVRGTSKIDPGRLDVPVVVGGATIRPGDVVVMDDDGAVVVPGRKGRRGRGGGAGARRQRVSPQAQAAGGRAHLRSARTTCQKRRRRMRNRTGAIYWRVRELSPSVTPKPVRVVSPRPRRRKEQRLQHPRARRPPGRVVLQPEDLSQPSSPRVSASQRAASGQGRTGSRTASACQPRAASRSYRRQPRRALG